MNKIQLKMVRAPCCEKMGLKKGPWSYEEDQILISYVDKHGHGNWRALPKQAGLLRCGKSCRLRWINYLRPDIKRGNFTKVEEETIIRLHQKMGNRWSAIASHLPGRTDNEIKNVWHTHLKKRLTQNHLNTSKTNKYPIVSANGTTLSDCTSTATMQPELSTNSFGTWRGLASTSACTTSNSTDLSPSVSEVSTKSIGSNKEDKVNFDDMEESLHVMLPREMNESFWTEPPPVWDVHGDSTVLSSDFLYIPDDERMQIQFPFDNSNYGSENDNGMSFWYDLFVTAGNSLGLLGRF